MYKVKKLVAMFLTVIMLLSIAPLELLAEMDASVPVNFLGELGGYTVQFSDYDGSPLKEVANVDFGTLASTLVPDVDPAREGYTFMGWYPTVVDYTIMKDEVFIA